MAAPRPANSCAACRNVSDAIVSTMWTPPNLQVPILTILQPIITASLVYDALALLPQSSGAASELLALPGLIDVTANIDPFRHESIRKPTVNAIARKELLQIIQSPDNMRQVASSYFASISRRIPILSAERFLERLPSASFTGCDADFATLCLCVCLILEIPPPDDVSMQSSLYVKLKGIISMLEATSCHSLEVIQARILVSYYELGHGLHPAAGASIGACGKIARFIGLRSDFEHSSPEETMREVLVEEKRRTLWALHNLDRYINLCTQESLFVTPFPQGTDPLPMEEIRWPQNIASNSVVHTLNTPSDVSIASFARECQICHLVSQVLRNVYEPTSDASFQAQEAEQLEATMMAFIPLLREDGEEFGKYCISFAICSSALYTLYAFSLESNSYSPQTRARRNALLEETSLELTRYCRRLFEIEEEINYGTLSPFVPYALYQSAIIQLRLVNQNHSATYADNISFLKQVLGYFTKRWLVAAKYLRELEKDSPPLILNIT